MHPLVTDQSGLQYNNLYTHITRISEPQRGAGEEVHSSEFKKHKKAVLGIIVEMEVERTEDLPTAVLKDITDIFQGWRMIRLMLTH